MYVAKVLSQHQQSKEELKSSFKPIIISILVICGLILPANLSTAVLLFATCWALMFIGRMDFKYLITSLGAIFVIFMVVLTITLNLPDKGRVNTWKNRIENFVSGEGEANHQANQAKIAIATGGFFGKGPGNSTQRNFLPQAYSDFIYAIIVEEYGLFGGILILFLYLYLLYRTGVIVKKSSRTFPALLAIGLTISLVFQALANMAVAVNLIPVTGQTLPFVSMGGTSIFFTSIAFGLILSVSRSIQNEENKIDKEELAIPE
jgi:cell division protein FtsW